MFAVAVPQRKSVVSNILRQVKTYYDISSVCMVYYSMSEIKPKQVRVYLETKDLEYLKTLADSCHMRDTAILGSLCAAALQAVRANNNRFPLPLRFNISEGLPEAPKARLSLPVRK